MGGPIFRHGLNKGGLDQILSTQKLIATEARSIRGGASAVRAMNGPWGLPYKGDTPGIEFTTRVAGTPQKFGGMDGMAWYMEEGEFLEIHVTKVVYPGGRVDVFPEPAPAPAPPPPVVEEIPPPATPEAPAIRPTNSTGRAFLEKAKSGFRAGLKGLLSAEMLVMIGADILLAVADRAAAKSAIKRIQIFFIKEGFAKGVAAAVMHWSEDEVASEAMNRVTHFRVQGMGDEAGILKLSYILKLAETYENYSVGVGYFWASQKPDDWKKSMLVTGTKRLAENGYNNAGKPDRYFFEYEFLANLAWALRPQSDAIVTPAIKEN